MAQLCESVPTPVLEKQGRRSCYNFSSARVFFGGEYITDFSKWPTAHTWKIDESTGNYIKEAL